MLLVTRDAVLVEAAPDDTIWGVFLGISDEGVLDRSKWRGQDVFGYALMHVRRFLRDGDTATQGSSQSSSAEPVGFTAPPPAVAVQTEPADSQVTGGNPLVPKSQKSSSLVKSAPACVAEGSNTAFVEKDDSGTVTLDGPHRVLVELCCSEASRLRPPSRYTKAVLAISLLSLSISHRLPD